jgi:hypothetical protein
MKLPNLVSISNESTAVHIETHSKSGTIMNKKLKFNFHTVVILPIACLLAFSSCASIEGTVENHRGTINLLKSIEPEHEKPENPPVHPGRPYNRHDAADRDVVAVSPSSTDRLLKAAGDRSDSRHPEA